jgi:hypothetical protein
MRTIRIDAQNAALPLAIACAVGFGWGWIAPHDRCPSPKPPAGRPIYQGPEPEALHSH